MTQRLSPELILDSEARLRCVREQFSRSALIEGDFCIERLNPSFSKLLKYLQMTTITTRKTLWRLIYFQAYLRVLLL